MNIVLEDAGIQQVTSRTEGWLVGMQLVGLSLQGRTTPSPSVDLLEEASGKQGYILDYLTEEVLRLHPNLSAAHLDPLATLGSSVWCVPPPAMDPPITGVP